MALPTLHWRKLTPVAPAAATIYGVLDALWTAGTAATYYDGTARTPGAGSAWTWSRFQAAGNTEASYASPPTVTALAQRVIFGGSALARTPTFRTPDTWAINQMLVSVNKNSGAFNAWDAALPFTGGQWFGYWKAGDITTNISYIHLLESEEAVAVVFERSTGTCGGCLVGALWEPGSTDAMDAETDGRLYGIMSGGTGVFDGNFLSDYAQFPSHNVGANARHAGVFVPGTGNIWTTTRQTFFPVGALAGTMVKASGKPVVRAFDHYDLGSKNFVGTTREFGYTCLTRTGRKAGGATDAAYAIACTTSGDDDAIAVLA